ncbi:MAG: NAD-glutamate dehydrogenase, partial [Ectothiorhodospiraceae bacterium]
DAFASGGSTGYDHKKMGITARGGWEAVKRHFREMGHDIQTEPFTAVGVGDMSGDVFGNGMLLSEKTRLLAAFDHRHIFIDPDPDTETSYAERQRMFALDRSSWADYDSDKISKGGGVWPRTAKSIQLSREAREALGIDAARLTPNELISAILRAPVDLLWNGGIGTYIKASDETDADVGDKANDAVRVDAEELRCRVIGEGGNLGVTQLGRIEFAQHGGRVNTDAIDNSGGVDCSDHEVNIKILVNRVVDAGDMTMKQRNRLLLEMTEEVAGLVLRNNYRQTQGLTLLEVRAPDMLDEHARFMRDLERAGALDRRVEHLPDDEELAERQKAGQGLTRPELAVLLAYAKIQAYEELLHSELVQTEFLATELMNYFPRPIRERFADAVRQHPLSAEIVATVTTNHIINRMGSTFLYRVHGGTGAGAAGAGRAYLAARDSFGLRGLWREVDRLDNAVPAAVQNRMLQQIAQLQERATVWMLRNVPTPVSIEEAIERFRPAVAKLESTLDELLPESDKLRLETEASTLMESGVPEPLARRVANLDTLYSALDLVKACADTRASLDTAARVYFQASTELGLDWLREALIHFEASDPWQERYRAGLEEEFYVQQRLLTEGIIAFAGESESSGQVAQWAEANADVVQRLQLTMEELRRVSQVELPMLGVALQELRNVSQVGAAQVPLESSTAEPQARRA